MHRDLKSTSPHPHLALIQDAIGVIALAVMLLVGLHVPLIA